MIIKTYEAYIVKKFLSSFLQISLIFFSLVFLLSLLEEINYFKDVKVDYYFPIILTILNAPSVFYETLPFVFLISTQFFFIRLIDKNELIIFKNFGITNLNILRALFYISVLIGIFTATIFYQFSSSLKFSYLELKNKYSTDNKYLAVITENGLWIKDEINDEINLINADKIDGDFLLDVEIANFNNDFELLKIINAKKINIKNTNWIIEDAKVSRDSIQPEYMEMLDFKSNFNSTKINSLFSNLSSLSYFEIKKLAKDYKSLGYSTVEIKAHLQKLYSYPIYLVIMVIFSGIIMMNIKYNKAKIFNLVLGILLSVIIYYVNYFSDVIGQKNDLPVTLTVWMPKIFIFFIITIGLIRINEK
tara:strand:+ start:471 stop:1553 length:1083 start_codon:yes stop_codon:yes gene_type:complete